ncbi:hypothetical protein [Yoonia sp.]|uniref:hypothetical protein n=1 Tax=Yoonia sp. TaxID=2212373 RepID=UPI00391BBA3B
MDEIKVEKTPTSTHTTINRTEAAPSGSGSMIWFIVGGLLVAVIVVAYFVMGDGMPTTNASAPTGGDVSVNVETAPAPAAEATPEAAPAETAPEPAPVVE